MLGLILYIAIIGLIVYAITTFIPMAPPFQRLIYILAGVACLIILFNALGGADVRLPSLR